MKHVKHIIGFSILPWIQGPHLVSSPSAEAPVLWSIGRRQRCQLRFGRAALRAISVAFHGATMGKR